MKLRWVALTAAAAWLTWAAATRDCDDRAITPPGPRAVQARAALPTISKPARDPSENRAAAAILSPPAGRATFDELEQRLASSSTGSRDLVLAALLPPLVASDPQRAARFAELQADDLRERALRIVALAWGASDAQRAVAWAEELPDAAERDDTITDIANGLASRDPGAAVALRARFTRPGDRDVALENLVQQWAGFDFEAARAWVESRPPGPSADFLLERLVYVQAAHGDAAAAARILGESAMSDSSRADAVKTIAQEWAAHDIDGAREWIDGLDDDARALAANEIAIAGKAPTP